MFKLIACIVVYNNSIEEINELINEFFKENINQKLVIVDNSNIKDLKDKILLMNPEIDYISNINNGYGSANNIAIKKYIGKSKYFLIMNPDIFIKFENLKKLITYADEKDNFGIIMPKILSLNNEIQYLCKLLPNPLNLFARRFLIKLLYLKKLNYNYELRFTGYDKELIVPVLSGCFMFCNYNNLIKEGGFDEKFFMYLEDVDLSRRMFKYINYYTPDISVLHKHKKESYKNLKMTLFHIKSGIKYYNKWGWFLDKNRRKINSDILKKYKKGTF